MFIVEKGITMTNEDTLNLRLKLEFQNPVYDILDEAITYTMHKHHYQKYDLVKLIMMLYNKDYSYISNAHDYRDQFKLLDGYFQKEYGHSIVTFLMIKAVLNYKDTEKYEKITADIASIETLLRTKKNIKAEDLCLFSYPIENEKYNDLMLNIEANPDFKYALAIVYDKIKNTENPSN